MVVMWGRGDWNWGGRRGVKRGVTERGWHSSAKDEFTCQRYEIFEQIFFKVNLRISRFLSLGKWTLSPNL